MRLDELAGERQPKPERRLAPSAAADAVKAREDARLIFGLDPRAIVGDGDNRVMIIAIGAETNVAAALGVGDGVAQNVLEAFAQAAGIADDDPGREFDGDVERLVIIRQARVDRLDRGAAQTSEIPARPRSQRHSYRRGLGRGRR